ncbi:ring-cleaving dioxygenase [Niallia circulans]|uniref:ring-cleaving dioxygenase n=1 Tax=Niallia circulans TaxID=1397 RepID=UPI000BA50D8B|nr:ring-cleaving dioxygenase [Niallia circulans]PAD27660.1 ring-cleaving dioxygenase [Niallia circulans]PAD89306.1 ring-cleaving dioxygenase [Niallia circulans]PAE13686.1 ring-cleaving dioxygenase [Niallia circulans]
MNLKGIHHVSAMTAKAKENHSFYTNILGLRLIKKTVNQDNPSVYHLFYGDEQGRPGTELTFFEIPHMALNREGVSSISATSLRVPCDRALEFWLKRFEEYNVKHGEILERAGRLTLEFRDFETQRFFLVSDENDNGVKAGIPWAKSSIPAEFAITGLGPVQLTVRRPEATISVLTDLLGFRLKTSYPSTMENQPPILVFETGEGGSGAEIHLEERNDLKVQRLGRGGVHHVALRADNEEELYYWIEKVNNARFQNSGYVDRFYFKSLYFRDPNGILFEIATDGPGFATDEDLEHLGESLALPPFLESKRLDIEAILEPLETRRKEK